MCNLDKIYALLLLEGVASEERIIASRPKLCRQRYEPAERGINAAGRFNSTERMHLSRFFNINSAVIAAPEEQY